ncbi:vomeronasal type-1 receptor 4-like [Nannospalax galili]|uniref:Vomeronasal type-1 receptor n=1 Tax=Nannospalax galili TaxID=1026970 RepID=A0A4Y1N5V3_NANGA|nr:vomeronasal type-1 receptor 4-like [Nannospalax galili]AWV49872.1 vomeronasal type 1 receptor 13 [Nannospalax galili]AWV49874.1 vomeronasal type 1 receptor 13 [Nannospalax galili]AWV49878.1 vomeronasal type 1 receptor 13 [Nannospalax galili]AWV49884.1 vomeronasal type 1 receptor 13 [Nannospalax galili]
MNFWKVAMGIFFLSQNVIGILGNFSLLSYYLVLYYRKCMLKSTDLILMHLLTVNSLIILSKGVQHTMAAFGLKQGFSDFWCNLCLYIERVCRSMSVASTCLFSVFQAITTSPRVLCWKDHKVRAPKHIGLSISLCWVLYVVVNLIFPVYTYTKMNYKNVTRKRDFGYCCIISHNEITVSLYIALLAFPEVLFSVLMVWCSSSMVVILYRHKQRVQHICRAHDSTRTSPEARATQSILALVSTFLAFYSLSSILQGSIALLYNPDWWLVSITSLVSL